MAKTRRAPKRAAGHTATGGNPVVEQVSVRGIAGGTMIMSLEYVYPGKGSRIYGPYWYAMQSLGAILRRVYVGRDRDDAKGRKRLAAKFKAADC